MAASLSLQPPTSGRHRDASAHSGSCSPRKALSRRRPRICPRRPLSLSRPPRLPGPARGLPPAPAPARERPPCCRVLPARRGQSGRREAAELPARPAFPSGQHPEPRRRPPRTHRRGPAPPPPALAEVLTGPGQLLLGGDAALGPDPPSSASPTPPGARARRSPATATASPPLPSAHRQTLRRGALPRSRHD